MDTLVMQVYPAMEYMVWATFTPTSTVWKSLNKQSLAKRH